MNPLAKKLLALGASTAVAVSGGYLVGKWEGTSNEAYKDMVGVVTICYGQTKNVKMGDYRTDEQCEKDLADDLTKYNAAMKKYVKVQLSQAEEVAYTSFIWNLGETNWRTSTMLRKLNAGDREGACAQLLRWDKAGGKSVKGLANRRKDEFQTCTGNRADINEALASLALAGYDKVDVENGEPNAPLEANTVVVTPPEPSKEPTVERKTEIIISPTPVTPVCKFKIFNWCISK